MLTKFFKQRFLPELFSITRSLVTKPTSDLSSQMKAFNSAKQFRKTLQLFTKSKENSDTDISSRSIIFLVLKACAELRDLQLGFSVHHRISINLKDDPYILASLIDLYSNK